MKSPSATDPVRQRAATLVVATLLASAAADAGARIVEEQADLPVKVTDAYGKIIAQPIRVTIFRDDAAKEARPLVVINHGRAVDAQQRAALGRARYSVASTWFVRQGFIAALPTRVGYGVSGGEDVEDSGPCASKRYPPGYEAAAEQTLAVIEFMRARDDVQKARVVVLGQSYGGATSVAVAARNPTGVVAAINFAGGGGGNPETHPGSPCAPRLLERMFADWGRGARVPMLWIYTENDKFMGAEFPREWFEAYRKEGGKGEFVQMPATGSDGHALFASFPAQWQPVVSEFLSRQGFDIKRGEVKAP